jgi:hypothetical protein
MFPLPYLYMNRSLAAQRSFNLRGEFTSRVKLKRLLGIGNIFTIRYSRRYSPNSNENNNKGNGQIGPKINI